MGRGPLGPPRRETVRRAPRRSELRAEFDPKSVIAPCGKRPAELKDTAPNSEGHRTPEEASFLGPPGFGFMIQIPIAAGFQG